MYNCTYINSWNEEEAEHFFTLQKSRSGRRRAMTTRQAGERMKCISCEDNYDAREAGTCKECYEEANETEEELKREINDLKAKVAFLNFCSGSPVDTHYPTTRSHPIPFSDVVLVASQDASVPVPAHKAVLVSTHFAN